MNDELQLNKVMYTSQKQFTEKSLNQFNTIKGTGPVVSGMPGAAAVRRGSQFLNSITDESERRGDSDLNMMAHTGGGVTYGAKEKQAQINKKISEGSTLQFGAKYVNQRESEMSMPDGIIIEDKNG